MGLFDFIGDLASATVKIAVTPVALVKDIVDVSNDEDSNTTKELLRSAGEEIKSAVDKLIP